MATKRNETHETSEGPAQALRVVSKREGFRRGGHVFGAAPKVIALADLSEAQADAIGNEPMLVVTVGPLPQSTPAEK